MHLEKLWLMSEKLAFQASQISTMSMSLCGGACSDRIKKLDPIGGISDYQI
jgi:hypothetical protein